MSSTATAEPQRNSKLGPFVFFSASIAIAILGVDAAQVAALVPPYPQNMWEMLAHILLTWQKLLFILGTAAVMLGQGDWDPGPTYETPGQFFRRQIAQFRANNRFPLGAILILAVLSYPFWFLPGMPPVGLLAIALGFALVRIRHLILNTGIAGRTLYLLLWFGAGWAGTELFSETSTVTLPCKADAEIRLLSGETISCEAAHVLERYGGMLFSNGNTAFYTPIGNIEETSLVASTVERAIVLFINRRW